MVTYCIKYTYLLLYQTFIVLVASISVVEEKSGPLLKEQRGAMLWICSNWVEFLFGIDELNIVRFRNVL